MEIKRLAWDSDFFEREVFAATITAAEEDDVASLNNALRQEGADLAYVFLQKFSKRWHEQLTAYGATLFDEKITYGKKCALSNAIHPDNVNVYNGRLTNELFELALLAGHESRFKKDPALVPYFESLYKLWLENSIKGNIADKIFVYRTNGRIKGMVTCKISNGYGNIGLIATAGNEQGKGIGQALMLAVDEYYNQNKVDTSTVVTQGSNKQACRFYVRAGFTEFKKEYVYHWWFK